MRRTTTWPGMPPRNCRSYWNFCSSTGYGSVGYGTVGCVAKNYIKVSANVADTVRPKIAGAKDHPGWHALQPAGGGSGGAGPGGGGPPGNRRLRDVGHQARVGLLIRLPARPVRRHWAVGGRSLAVAVLLADIQPGDIGSEPN